jgi:ribonuclease BN (tRNA processing enzyme)
MLFLRNNLLFIKLIAVMLLGTSTVFAGDDKGKSLAGDRVKGALSVMVLGSGGPIATASGRASAGYLIFVDGEPRILMDAGGGTYQRLAASGVDVRNLDIILLSHLHIDHTSDMSAIIKTVYFHNRVYNLANGTFPPGRTAAIRIFGPGENGAVFPPVLGADPTTTQYPSSSEYVHSHYELNSGIERYLNIFSRAISGGIFNYSVEDKPAGWMVDTTSEILNEGGLVIKSIGVNHGPVPALGFRIEYKGKSIVYSGDTSSVGQNMITLADGADLLIYDTAITDTLPNGPNDAVFFALHTTPSRMGEVAAAANVKKLVLSHLTPNTEPRIDEVSDLIRAKGYSGKISTARDLKVYNLFRH